jgi:hypothetical protein
MILIDPSNKEIDKIIKQLREHNFDVQDEGQIKDFLGVQIQHKKDGTIEMSQPHLVQQIFQDLALLPPNGATTKPSKYTPKSIDTPAASTVILERNPEGKPHKETWSYQSVIGKLNYLEKSSRPDLAYFVHNVARFSSDPKTKHSQAVKCIGRY